MEVTNIVILLFLEKTMEYYVGVDVSEAKLDTSVGQLFISASNDVNGFKALKCELNKQIKAGNAIKLIACEARRL